MTEEFLVPKTNWGTEADLNHGAVQGEGHSITTRAPTPLFSGSEQSSPAGEAPVLRRAAQSAQWHAHTNTAGR